MKLRDLGNIHTTGNSYWDTLPCAIFLPADGEASWSLLPDSISLLSSGKVQPENTYSCILMLKASPLITATSSVEFPRLVSSDLKIKLDLVLTNPIRKDRMQSWSM